MLDPTKVLSILGGVTLFLLLTLFTVHRWAWWLPSLRWLQAQTGILRSVIITATNQELHEFVETKHNGDKIVIYHHFRCAVDDFLATAPRRGLQALIVIFSVMLLIFVVLVAVQGANASFADATKTLAIMIGATDLLGAIWFYLEFSSLEKEIATIARRLS